MSCLDYDIKSSFTLVGDTEQSLMLVLPEERKHHQLTKMALEKNELSIARVSIVSNN